MCKFQYQNHIDRFGKEGLDVVTRFLLISGYIAFSQGKLRRVQTPNIDESRIPMKENH